MTVGTFANCAFFLKVKHMGIREKNRLKRCIETNGGQIKFVLNHECTHVVTDDADVLTSIHRKTIQKHQLPIVAANFIWDSAKQGRLLQMDNFESPKTIKGITVLEDISTKEEKSPEKNVPRESSEKNISGLGCFSNNDENAPYFPEDFEVAKYDILEQVTLPGEYVVVELQCSEKHCDYPFRICMHYSVLDGKRSQKRFIPTKTSEEARRVYARYTESLQQDGFQFKQDFPSEADYLASVKLQEMLVAEAIDSNTLSEEVGVFVELIWAEAIGLLSHLLANPVTSISLNDVSKAEGVLHQTRKALDEGKMPRELTTMITEFYKIIPHKNGVEYHVTKKLLSTKQDLCQLIRDMLNVRETSMATCNPPSLSKYQALRCKVDFLDADGKEFDNIKKQVIQNNFSEFEVEVLQIYKVGRITETASFESNLGNVQSLFHATSGRNLVGILSRGLLLPKIIVEEHGLERTDCGNLGSGIYFSNSISTSIKYTLPNKIEGTRLLIICDVALGTCLDTSQKDFSLTAAPPGYDSVHGVRKTKEKDSAFEDDEFVVYRTGQVKIRYVVKFCLANKDRVKVFHPSIETEIEGQTLPQDPQSPPEDYKIPSSNLLNEIPSGLQDKSGNPIPLKNIHIKGRVIDFVAQIVTFQTYENQNDIPIEAKYVFPLDDTAAVCGFEAFIKGKHIIGEVKEKETARKEYKEAVSRGDGAYLMDQDAPDIFTVSVGNLPPLTKVVIKITYIMELAYSHGRLSCHLPAALAPWQQDKALNENTQDSITKVSVKQVGTKQGDFSLEMSVEMPFKINDVVSWTHQLERKITDCKAMVRTVKDSSLDISGFAMEIMIGDAHLPRMWVEKHPDKPSEACMLVFQPEFEEEFDIPSTCGETIICLDCSNSMAGSEIHQAKQIALHALDLYRFVATIRVIKFGTNFVEFPFDPDHSAMDVPAMKEFIKSATPTMGNSELWKPLRYLSLLYPKDKRNILLISDGHIQDEGITLQIVKKSAKHTRIFTCGVSSTANRHMLRSLAQYGAGAFEYFNVKSKYNWETKIKNQVNRMYSPGCSAVSITWQQFDSDTPDLMYAPAQIQSLFNHEHLLIYGFISHCTQATLNALVDNRELQTMVSTTELQKTTGTMLHKLAARAFIKDYEQGFLHDNETEHEVKKQTLQSLIIKLSLENSIVTQFTSFVAVEKRDASEDQGTDTLNVLELVAKEDVDILPYMQYQSGKWRDTESRDMDSRLDLEMDLVSFLSISSSSEHSPTDELEKMAAPRFTLHQLGPLPPAEEETLRDQRKQTDSTCPPCVPPPYTPLSDPCPSDLSDHFSIDLEALETTLEPNASLHTHQAVELVEEDILSVASDSELRYIFDYAPCLCDVRVFSGLSIPTSAPLPAEQPCAKEVSSVATIPSTHSDGLETKTKRQARGSFVESGIFKSGFPLPPPPPPGGASQASSLPTTIVSGPIFQSMQLDTLGSSASSGMRQFSTGQFPFGAGAGAHTEYFGSGSGTQPLGLGAGMALFGSGSGMGFWGSSSASDLPVDLGAFSSDVRKSHAPEDSRENQTHPRDRVPAPIQAQGFSFTEKPHRKLPVCFLGWKVNEEREAVKKSKKTNKRKKTPAFSPQHMGFVPWPQLFQLQNQDGFWQLTPELGTILDLDVDHLINVTLAKGGIQSLGPKGKEKLLQLIATLLVLQTIRFKQLEGLLFQSLFKLNDSRPSRAFDSVKKAVEWARRTERQFPAICQRLDLGKDWDSATKKLLHIEVNGTNPS